MVYPALIRVEKGPISFLLTSIIFYTEHLSLFCKVIQFNKKFLSWEKLRTGGLLPHLL